MEADLYPPAQPQMSDFIDGSLGPDTLFDKTHGIHADGVSPNTATLPAGWADRLIPICNANTNGATGWCIDRKVRRRARESSALHSRLVGSCPARPRDARRAAAQHRVQTDRQATRLERGHHPSPQTPARHRASAPRPLRPSTVACRRRSDRPPYTDAQLRGSTPGSAQQTRVRSRLKGKAGHRRARTILGLGRKPGQSIEFPGQRADGGGVPKSVGCGFVRADDPARYKDDAGRTPRATGR